MYKTNQLLHPSFLLLAAGLAFLFYQIVRNAGVTEDAFITFRVIDNFVHGYGLRWNIHERVQVYTNPFWMMLHIPFYAIWKDIYSLAIALSLACTIAALLIAYRTLAVSHTVFSIFFVLPLASSYGFVTHSICGLENPLSHLLFAAFVWALLRNNDRYYWFFTFLFAGLSILNRLDMALICIPAVCFSIYQKGLNQQSFLQCSVGALPIVAWLVFSVWYYGFIFPNTKYAKLDTGISQLEYLRYGMGYTLNFMSTDPVGFLCVISALFIGPVYWFHQKKQSHKAVIKISLALGLLTYAFYIIMVGGTFVSGRFWSLPVFIACWLICGCFSRKKLSVYAAVFVIGIWALLNSESVGKYLLYTRDNFIHTYPDFLAAKVDKTDLRINVFYPRKIPSMAAWERFCPNCFAQDISTQPVNNSKYYTIRGAVGFYGYKAGPNAVIVDFLGLTDPLISRLPSAYGKITKGIGNIRRSVPEGYLHAIKTGQTDKLHPSLAEYYKRIRIITMGDLWSVERLQTIIEFNLGYYDHYLEHYLQATARQPMSRRQNPSGQSMASTAR